MSKYKKCVGSGVVLVVFLVLTLLAPSLPAQTGSTGALTGTVTDPSGGAVPNAMVTITSDTGAIRTATTGADGSYKFSLLPPGSYRVRFEAAGFNSEEIGAAQVDVTETEVLNRTLVVGSQTQNVTVEATVETIQTQNSTLGTVVRSETVVGLPLSTRNFTNLISMSAGAAASVNNAMNLGRGSQNVAVNGAASSQNNFQVDGVSSNMYGGTNNLTEGGNTGQPPIPNPDALEQFKIQTSTYDASYGRNSGANVNVVTKSGSNNWHGAAFEFFRNTVLNSNEYFNIQTQNSKGVPNKQSAMNQNQYGGTIGGPVKRDKLFFFISYQETYQKNGFASQGNVSGLRFAPLPAGNRGTCPAGILTIAQMQAQCDAATQTFVGALGAAVCPNTNGGTNTNSLSKPIGGGVNVNCSGNNINPQAIQLLQLKLSDGSYYIPGSGTSTYTATPVNISIPAIYKEHQGMGNWDWLINSKHTLTGKYFLLTTPSSKPFPGGTFLPGTPETSEFGNQLAQLKLTSILSNTVVNDAHVSFKRSTNTIAYDAHDFTASQIGVTPVTPGSPFAFVPGVIITGMYSAGYQLQQDQSLIENTYEAADNISWSRGKHTIRSGFEWTHVQYKWLQPGYQIGTMTFATFADFLLGLPGCSTLGTACDTSKAIAQAGGPALIPQGYTPLPGANATNGTLVSNVDQIGTPTNRTDPGGLLHYFYSGNLSAFIQDDFKLTSRLTLNVGLRWEYDQFAADKYGDGVNYWEQLINLQPIPGSGCSFRGVQYGGVGGSGCSFTGFVAPVDFNTVKRGPLPAGVFQNSRTDPTASGPPKNNFAPRLGFAWQPLSTSRLVVRGGGGYFYDLIPGGNLGPPINQSPPYNNPINVPSGTGNFQSSLAQPFIPGTLGWTPRWAVFTGAAGNGIVGTTSQYNPGGGQGPISSNLITPLTYNYNLQVQYEFLPAWVAEIGYVGSKGIHQEIPTPVNAAPFASTTNPIHCGFNGGDPAVLANCITTNTISGANGPLLRAPYLGFSNSFHMAKSTGGYKYNSLQATLRKSLSHGISFNAAYTFSRGFISDYVGNPNASLSDNRVFIQDYAVNATYRPHRLVASYNWNLPFGKHMGILGAIASGWSVSGVTTIQSGGYLTITDSRNGSIFGIPGNVTSPAQFAAGKTAADVATSGPVQSRLSGLPGTPLRFLDAAAFTAGLNANTLPGVTTCVGATNTCGTLWGNSGRGIVRGPNQNNYDLTIQKDTRVGGLREDATLQFRAEFFNAFNHPQFSNPGTAFNSASAFGTITTTSVNPRFIQFGLKYVF